MDAATPGSPALPDGSAPEPKTKVGRIVALVLAITALIGGITALVKAVHDPAKEPSPETPQMTSQDSSELERYETSNAALRGQNTELQARNAGLTDQVKQLQAGNSDLKQQILQLQSTVRDLQQDVASPIRIGAREFMNPNINGCKERALNSVQAMGATDTSSGQAAFLFHVGGNAVFIDCQPQPQGFIAFAGKDMASLQKFSSQVLDSFIVPVP